MRTTQEICEGYLRHRQGTLTTLAVLQDVLRERLSDSGFRTIWLQGHIGGGAHIMVTLFSDRYAITSYRMFSCRLPNFRHFRPDGNITGEANRIDFMIDSIIRDARVPPTLP